MRSCALMVVGITTRAPSHLLRKLARHLQSYLKHRQNKPIQSRRARFIREKESV